MAETQESGKPVAAEGHEAPQVDAKESRRNEKVGAVVSTKMEKTIVVKVEMAKAHPKYKRVMRTSKKFYAHDEQNSARVGDIVRIRETRPCRSSSAGSWKRSSAAPRLRRRKRLHAPLLSSRTSFTRTIRPGRRRWIWQYR